MFQKLKPHLKWIIPLAVIIILLGLFVVVQSPKVTSVTVSPEVILTSTTTNQTLLSFEFKQKNSWPVFVASLKTPNLKIPLTQQSGGRFVGSTQIPSELLTKPQTISFDLYINGIKTSNVVRFAVTDVQIIIPPDPGEEGKKTLAGIDSDQDGVRDDLQREIVFMYPGNDEVRRVLRAMVKKEQDVITTTGDHEYFKELMIEYFSFLDCYRYLVFGSGTRDYTNDNMLWHMGQNTTERKRLIEANQYIATPFAHPIYGTSEACTQPLVQGKY